MNLPQIQALDGLSKEAVYVCVVMQVPRDGTIFSTYTAHTVSWGLMELLCSVCCQARHEGSRLLCHNQTPTFPTAMEAQPDRRRLPLHPHMEFRTWVLRLHHNHSLSKSSWTLYSLGLLDLTRTQRLWVIAPWLFYHSEGRALSGPSEE